MADQDKPKPTPPKNFQEEVADAIVSGNLAAFKKCCVGKNDINRRLLPHKELKAKPAHNPEERYINIRGPTMLMYAILCEREEIVEYILDNKSPDVGKEVEGYNCVHLAAMIKDPRCLKLLLQHEWIQENIDITLDLPDTHNEGCDGTTALHLAVSNRRYANVFLLLKKMPKARQAQKRDKQRTEELEDYIFKYKSLANVNKKSASGSTPLHIAVSLCDYKMVRILISSDSDIYIQNANGRTPLYLAFEYQQANNDKRRRLQNSKK